MKGKVMLLNSLISYIMILQTTFYIYLTHKCQFMTTVKQNMMKKALDPTNIQ